MYAVETYNQLLGLATFALQVVTLGFLALFLLQEKYPDLGGVGALIERWGLWLAFGASSVAVVLALFYSEVLGFVPCGLCWLMRIFMFSQVPLFAVALWKRDSGIADYSITLSIAGFFLGLYQHYLQMGGGALVPCPASGGGDCAQRFLFELNYITFPLMGATLFAFLIVLMLFVRKRRV
ncbi:disulfide bond formation protein B [Candidatus Kaiserbacteria bacterium]|nr:disulfide bond formation protein B [Candidatus Kaiserbacteria bacterium]